MTEFIRVDRPDLVDVEIRINWINPAAIALVTMQQRGNAISVKLYLVGGGSVHIKESAPARLFLQKWEEYLASN